MSFSPSYRPEGQWDCPWQDVSSSAQPCWGQVSSFEEPDGSYRTCSGHEAVAMGGGAYLPEPAVNYSSDVTPPDYVCKECGAVGSCRAAMVSCYHLRVNHDIQDAIKWNDTPGRTKEEVLELLERAAETAQ